MARKPSFKYSKIGSRWRVNIPSSLSESGQRERAHFESRDKARDFAQALRDRHTKHGNSATAIKPSLAEDATRAAELLQPWGKSLTEAARFMVEALKRDEASETLNMAITAWLASCEGTLRDRTIADYKQTANRLKAKLADRLLSSITPAELQSCIESNGATTYALHRRNARAFWRWSAKPPRGWCSSSAFDAVEEPRKSTDEGDIVVLNPAEVSALLASAEEHYPETVSAYAIALFTGLRAEELTRLTKRHVSNDGIELTADVTKKGRRRHVPMNATLRAWLNAYPFEGMPVNWREKDRAVRRLAGWQVQSAILPGHILPQDAPQWPQNAIRHTFASAAVAIGTTLDQLIFSFGHSGGVSLLRRHYVGRYTKKNALAFWSIGPNGTKLPAIKRVV